MKIILSTEKKNDVKLGLKQKKKTEEGWRIRKRLANYELVENVTKSRLR